jgi:hypothetical protein
MIEIPKKEINVLDIPLSNSLNVQSTYSNIVTAFAAEHDCRLVFMEVIMDSIKGTPHMETKANIVLSWSSAKALSTSLQQTIANYESRIKK